MWNAMEFIPYMDATSRLSSLAGIHSGCFEVFGNERVRSMRDLKGKTVAITYLGGGDHILLSSMLAYVGIDPREVNWMPGPLLCSMRWMLSPKARPTLSSDSLSNRWKCGAGRSDTLS